MHSSAVSSPGKVLLAGGYLVLDKAYSGLVFGLSARIHVHSSPLKDHCQGIISVSSPQFLNAHWSYQVSKNPDGSGVHVSQVEHEGSSENTFVETTIRYCLNYLSVTQSDLPFLIPSTQLTILADNDYYSQPESSTPLMRFNKLNVPIFEANKTGLGSSAALVTSLTAALLSTYSSGLQPLNLSTSENQRIIHNLAQAAHCAAQGKVGSGFDVAAAVFGSHIYHRFSPSILEPLQSSNDEADLHPNEFALRLVKTVKSTWDYSIKPTRIPPGLRVVMGDVDCGSATPGMVRHVLAWRKENPQEAKLLWDKIEALNLELIKILEELGHKAAEQGEEYLPGLYAVGNFAQALNDEEGKPNPTVELFRHLRTQISKIRREIRNMGEAAGVPIEPPSQTKLLDHLTKSCQGVIGGVVPGAGGYDAVALLIADEDPAINSITAAFKEWKFGEDEGIGSGRVRVLSAREEASGLRSEDIGQYAL